MRNSLLIYTNGSADEYDIMPNTEWVYLPIPQGLPVPTDWDNPVPPIGPPLQTRAFQYEGYHSVTNQRVYLEQPKSVGPGPRVGCAS